MNFTTIYNGASSAASSAFNYGYNSAYQFGSYTANKIVLVAQAILQSNVLTAAFGTAAAALLLYGTVRVITRLHQEFYPAASKANP